MEWGLNFDAKSWRFEHYFELERNPPYVIPEMFDVKSEQFLTMERNGCQAVGDANIYLCLIIRAKSGK